MLGVHGGLTNVEVRDGFQDPTVTAGVERLRTADLTGGISTRVQNDLGFCEGSGGDPLVQSLTWSNGCCYICRLFDRAPLVIGRIYAAQDTCRFKSSSERVGDDDGA